MSRNVTSYASGTGGLSSPKCSACRAVEWKERVVHFLCYSKKRRRKIKYVEMAVVEIKKCECVKDYCSHQQTSQGGEGGNE